MLERYSKHGPAPRIPSCMLRSCLLSIKFKITSITRWVALLKENPLYAILSGFSFGDVPGIGTFYSLVCGILILITNVPIDNSASLSSGNLIFPALCVPLLYHIHRLNQFPDIHIIVLVSIHFRTISLKISRRILASLKHRFRFWLKVEWSGTLCMRSIPQNQQ